MTSPATGRAGIPSPWRTVDFAPKRTGRAISKHLNIANQPGDFFRGTVTVWESLTVDEAGEALTAQSVVELRASDGTVDALFPFSGAAFRRLAVEPPPPLGAPDAGTPDAVTPSA